MFFFIFLFFALIIAGSWYAYQRYFFVSKVPVTLDEVQIKMGFKIPFDAEGVRYFSIKGVDQVVYLSFTIPDFAMPAFLQSFPCKKSLEEAKMAGFLQAFRREYGKIETNPTEKYLGMECTETTLNKVYNLVDFPNLGKNILYMSVYDLK